MGNFTININSQVIPPYTGENKFFDVQSCLTPYSKSISLGIAKDTDSSIITYILASYTGVGWDTIRIYDIEYSDDSTFYLEYNGNKLVPNIDPNVAVATIDVSTVLINQAIPTFSIEIDSSALTSNESIKFTVEVEDTATNLGGKVDVYFNLLPEECLDVPVEEITEVSKTITTCETTAVITVNVPPESSRYVAISASGSFTTIPLGLPETITSSKNYTLTIEGDNVGMASSYSIITVTVKSSAASAHILAAYTLTRNHKNLYCIN